MELQPEFKDDEDFLSKIVGTDANPEDVERFHQIINKKQETINKLLEAMKQAIKVWPDQMRGSILEAAIAESAENNKGA